MSRSVARWFGVSDSRAAKGVLAATSALLLTLAAHPVWACKLRPAEMHRIDPELAAVDAEPPEPPVVSSARVYRQEGQTCADGICTTTSCGDQGSVMIEVEPTADNRSAPGHIGYLLIPVDGVISGQVTRQMAEIRRGPQLIYREGFDAVLDTRATAVLVAVDEAGNQSDPSEPFELSFDGCTEVAGGGQCRIEPLLEGCALAGRHPGSNAAGPLWLLLAAALARGRLRRPRRVVFTTIGS